MKPYNITGIFVVMVELVEEEEEEKKCEVKIIWAEEKIKSR